MFEFAGVCKGRCHMVGVENLWLEYRGQSRLSARGGTDRHPTVYPGSYVEYVQKLGHEAPGIYS